MKESTMTKQDMAKKIARTIGGSDEEQHRIYRHHMSRPITSVRESFERQCAINKVTQREINRHCQPYTIYRERVLEFCRVQEEIREAKCRTAFSS
jgi:hypothetical protein